MKIDHQRPDLDRQRREPLGRYRELILPDKQAPPQHLKRQPRGVLILGPPDITQNAVRFSHQIRITRAESRQQQNRSRADLHRAVLRNILAQPDRRSEIPAPQRKLRLKLSPLLLSLHKLHRPVRVSPGQSNARRQKRHRRINLLIRFAYPSRILGFVHIHRYRPVPSPSDCPRNPSVREKTLDASDRDTPFFSRFARRDIFHSVLSLFKN